MLCFDHTYFISTQNYRSWPPPETLVFHYVSPPDKLNTNPVQNLWNMFPRTHISIFINHKQELDGFDRLMLWLGLGLGLVLGSVRTRMNKKLVVYLIWEQILLREAEPYHFWTHPDPSGSIRTHPDHSGPFRTIPDRSGPIQFDKKNEIFENFRLRRAPYRGSP